MADIKQFQTQNGTVYNFRDSRVDTLNQFDYGACTSAEDTPYGVEWEKDGTTITGTLVASVQTMYRTSDSFYFSGFALHDSLSMI